MAIGERIRYFRTVRGMTQKYLGLAVGFPEKTADVRIAQYETGNRTPKAEITAELAKVLMVSPAALDVPDLDTGTGLMQTLFALEDIYGLTVEEADGDVCLRVDRTKGADAGKLHDMLAAWQAVRKKLQAGTIDQTTYDHWRHFYPDDDLSARWVSAPSQEFSDWFTEALKEDGDK